MSRDQDPTRRSDQHNARGIELADRGWLDEAVKEFRRLQKALEKILPKERQKELGLC